MRLRIVFIVMMFVAVFAGASFSQSTEITYQGNMTAAGTAATGSHDFEFALFDAVSGGTQVGSTITVNAVAVTNGIFSVKLDFGNQFPGANRFLEIRVRTAGGGAFTTLSPRQSVNSAPYSIKSLNASNADTANTATMAASLSNPLAGDVTGTQSATTVARLRGRNVSANQPNNGQVLKFNTANSQWEPANDETASGGGGTITGVTAGTGLTGGGASGSVTVAIANGGVGTTQLADSAVTPAKLTGIVPVVRGGTGIAAAGAAGNYLRSDGTSWVSSAIQGSDLPTGSSNYIQNQNAAPQGSSNFNISGSGSATSFNAINQYNIGGFRVLSTPGSSNVFVGLFAGAGNTAGSANTFVGRNAGTANTTGLNNSFFGNNAGQTNSGGSNNSFFGSFAGQANTASLNSFFGDSSGFSNSTGSQNAFFGWSTGGANTTGSNNAFFGSTAGQSNVSGSDNAFFGRSAGSLNIASNNSFFGSRAGQANTTGTNNSFFGFEAGLSGPDGISNSFFGAEAGRSSADSSGNSYFGYRTGRASVSASANSMFGSQAGVASTGGGNSFFGNSAGLANVTGSNNVFIGVDAGSTNTLGQNNTVLGFNADVASGSLSNATAIGYRAIVSQNNSLVLGSINGLNGADSNVNVGIGTTAPGVTLQVVDAGGANGTARLGSATIWNSGESRRIVFGDGANSYVGEEDADDRLVLRGRLGVRFKGNASQIVGPDLDNNLSLGGASNRWTTVFAANGVIQTSDARLKENIRGLNYGLNSLMKLRPVSFDWKNSPVAKTKLGFLAQEVEKIIPEAVVKGDDENTTLGMNYSELLPVVVRSVQEQQAQITNQQALIDRQQKTIKSLEERLRKLESKQKPRR